jgi:hypothetical protein
VVTAATTTRPASHGPLTGALVALAAIVAHLPALSAGYVLDDDTLLVSNPYVRTWSGLRVLVTREFFFATARPEGSAQYRPVSGALNWVAWHLLGASSVAEHAANIALHAAVAVLALRAMEALGAPRRVAAAAAALFAVHPVTALDVAYVGGRQELLGWIFVLAALLAVTRLASLVGVATAAFAAILLATHCREAFAGAFLPLAAAALSRRSRPGPAALAVLGSGIAAFAATMALRRLVGVTAYPSPPWSFASLLQAAGAATARMLSDVVAPTDLALFVTPARLGTALAGLVVVGALACAVGCDRLVSRRALQARPLALTGLLAAAPAIAAGAVVLLQFDTISDRYAYGVVLAAALLGAALFQTVRAPLPRVAAIIPVVLVVAIVPLTWARAATFHDETTLQLAMIDERPDDPESQLAQGLRLFAQGDVEGAHPHCAAYASLVPRSDRANQCVAAWLLDHHRPREALALLRPYALARPGYAGVRRLTLATAFACEDYGAVQTFLAEWEPSFPGAPDLVAAREELARRGH